MTLERGRICRCCGSAFHFTFGRWDFAGAYRDLCPGCWDEFRASPEFRAAASLERPDVSVLERWLTALGGELMPRAVLQ